MISLPLAPRIPASLDEPFACAFYRATMRGRVCVERQGTFFVKRNKKQRRTVPIYEHCASGKCEQGRELAQALGGVKKRTPRLINLAAIGAARRKALKLEAPLITAEPVCDPAPAGAYEPMRSPNGDVKQPISETAPPAPKPEEPPMPKGIPTNARPCAKGCGRNVGARTPEQTLCGRCRRLKGPTTSAPAPAAESPAPTLPRYEDLPLGYACGLVAYLEQQRVKAGG